MLWNDGQPFYHVHHRVWHLGDVAALFLPGGDLHRQYFFGLEAPENESKLNEGVMRLCWMFISVLAYVLIEVANLTGEHAVFVRQETEASLFFQQSLSAAVSNELLHVHLA